MLYASHIYDGVGLDIVAVDLFTGEATVFSTISAEQPEYGAWAMVTGVCVVSIASGVVRIFVTWLHCERVQDRVLTKTGSLPTTSRNDARRGAHKQHKFTQST